MIFPGFIGPAYTAQSVTVACDQLVNLYLERVESGTGKAPACLIGRPGLSNFVTGLQGPIRQLFAQDGRVFAVGGGTFYEIHSNGTATVRGAVALDGGRPTICSNGDAGHQLFLVSGGFGYIYDLVANTLTQITAAAFPVQASRGDFLDGYFVVLARNTNRFGLSGLFNGLTWSGLDVAQRQIASDRLSTLFADHRELWLPGSQTTEVWTDTGAASFPLEPLQGAFIEVGFVADSVAKFDNTIAWLSQTSRGGGIVYRANGYQPVRISTHAIEHAISQYPTILDAEAFTEEFLGHTFYVVNFPSGGATWAYDAATQTWAQRDWWNAATGQSEQARPRCHCFGFNQRLVGDRALGTIYVESHATYTDAGTVIRRRRRAPHLMQDKRRMFYRNLELDMEVGIGMPTTPTTQPMGVLRYSNDGARTWSRDRPAQLGLRGQYLTRVQFPQLGSARDRVFEFEIDDPIRVAIAAAYLDASAGTH